MQVKILAVGDVVSRPGMDMLSRRLPGIIKYYGVDFTVVNGENASGVGITPRQAGDILGAGADVITLGNHTWNRMEIAPYLDEDRYILRPANFAPQVPGRGWGVYDARFGQVLVINLIGRCDMPFGSENPFFAVGSILKEQAEVKVVLVDMHAEATSEKLAMGYYLDGRVSAVWGTHTHVQTSDGMVLPKGTGYVTDIGMTGPLHSVLGIRADQSVSMFLGNPPQRYESAAGDTKLECALFHIDSETGRCAEVETLRITD